MPSFDIGRWVKWVIEEVLPSLLCFQNKSTSIRLHDVFEGYPRQVPFVLSRPQGEPLFEQPWGLLFVGVVEFYCYLRLEVILDFEATGVCILQMSLFILSCGTEWGFSSSAPRYVAHE